MIYTVVTLSICALSLKLITLYQLRALLRSAPYYVWVPVLSFVGMNITELVGFKLASNPLSPNTYTFGYPLLIVYYVLLTTALQSLLFLPLHTSSAHAKWWAPPLIILYCATLFAIVVPGVGIAGMEHIGYTGTRIPGNYYFIIQIGIVVPALLIPAVSIFNIKRGEPQQRQAAYVHLACFTPIVIAVIFVFLLMLAGLKINGAAILSLAVCIPVWVLLYSRCSTNRYILLTRIPLTPERKLLEHLRRTIATPTSGMDEKLETIEKNMLLAAVAKADGNRSEAARILGIGRSKLLRRLEKYCVKIDD